MDPALVNLRRVLTLPIPLNYVLLVPINVRLIVLDEERTEVVLVESPHALL